MKTTSRHFFGIDLGTSSCSIAYATADPRQKDAPTVGIQTVEIPVEGGHAGQFTRRIPSYVSAPPEAARGGAFFGALLGGPQKKKKDQALLRRGRDFFSSVKSDLGTLKVYTRSRVPGCRTPAEVTTVILDRLRGLAHDANAALDLSKAPVVITVPASYSALARTETLDAAARAGFDRARVRLLDPVTGQLLREHLRQERGRHRIHPDDAPSRTPATTVQLLHRAHHAGHHIGALCDQIHRTDGEIGVKRILGVLSLARKHGAPTVDDAAKAAIELGAPSYRFLRRYLERRPAAPLSLRQVDPLIRQLSLYRDLITQKTGDPT